MAGRRVAAQPGNQEVSGELKVSGLSLCGEFCLVGGAIVPGS